MQRVPLRVGDGEQRDLPDELDGGVRAGGAAARSRRGVRRLEGEPADARGRVGTFHHVILQSTFQLMVHVTNLAPGSDNPAVNTPVDDTLYDGPRIQSDTRE
jgi:hypothetical protein